MIQGHKLKGTEEAKARITTRRKLQTLANCRTTSTMHGRIALIFLVPTNSKAQPSLPRILTLTDTQERLKMKKDKWRKLNCQIAIIPTPK